MKQWKCTLCGYIHTGDEPPEKCPVCGADKSKFILVEPAESEAPEETEAEDEKKRRRVRLASSYLDVAAATFIANPQLFAERGLYNAIDAGHRARCADDANENRYTFRSKSTAWWIVQQRPGEPNVFVAIDVYGAQMAAAW